MECDWMGYCYGRLMSIERGYRHLSAYQQQLVLGDRLARTRAIVTAKLNSSRILRRRQLQRRQPPLLEQVRLGSGLTQLSQVMALLCHAVEQKAKLKT